MDFATEYIAFFVGLFLVVSTFANHRKARKALSWPATSGKVLSSSVDCDDSGESTVYKPKISYEYQVNGRSYVGDVWRIGFDTGNMSRKISERAVQEYPAGRIVPVYFDPDDPRQAVLEPGQSSWGSAVLGAIFILLGLTVVVPLLSRLLHLLGR